MSNEQQVWSVTYTRDSGVTVANPSNRHITDEVWQAGGEEFGVDWIQCFVRAKSQDVAITRFWELAGSHVVIAGLMNESEPQP